jgi:hypothetical protein
MSGDFSRQTLDREKQFCAVYAQQGRVWTDYDWNAAQAVIAHRLETEAIDVIGDFGVPKGPAGGFSLAAAGGNLTIGKGRGYVCGLLVDNPTPRSLDAAGVAGVTDLPPGGPGLYLAYIKVWQRLITAVEEPAIREVALGGPDTTTRLVNSWQVRFFRLGNQDATASCATTPAAAWVNHVAPSDGMLTVGLESPGGGGPSRCELPASAGYRGLENQLYRVEVHRGGDLPSAQPPTFKWSRENASVVTAITTMSGSKLTVEHVGKDQVLGFASGQWVEIRDDALELAEKPGYLRQIDPPNEATNEITLRNNIPSPVDTAQGHAKLIRWDQTTGPADGIVMQTGPIPLENNLTVQFSPGHYRTGDYWLIPARTAIQRETGTVEWPQDGAGHYLALPPFGPRRCYAKLALVNFDGAKITTLAHGDCRKRFPPLTAITAEDVSFDNTSCKLEGAETVQEALDALCHRTGSMCTLLVGPDEDLAKAIAKMGPVQDALICLRTGTYQLVDPVVLQDRGTIILQGCGTGTRIVAPRAEIALKFAGCRSVTVRDVYVESQVADRGTKTPSEFLNGALTFLECAAVTVERVTVACAAGALRAATCITIRRTEPKQATQAHVHGCTLRVGHLQTGILVVNVDRTHVEDNVLLPGAPPNLASLLRDADYRGALRRGLMSGMQLSLPGAQPPAGANATVTFNNQVVHFRTDPALAHGDPQKTEWQRATLSINPANITSPLLLQRFLRRLASQLILHQGGGPGGSAVFGNVIGALLKGEASAVASQGIVVAGISAREVQITGNTLREVMQGIHVGLSSGDPQAPRIPAGVAVIRDNAIGVALPPAATRDRHAVFVGSCDSVVIDSNRVTLRRDAHNVGLRVEGIRLFGDMGLRVIVRHNHLGPKFDAGIVFAPLNQPVPNRPLWIITENEIEQAPAAVVVPAKGQPGGGVVSPNLVRQRVRGIADNFS